MNQPPLDAGTDAGSVDAAVDAGIDGVLTDAPPDAIAVTPDPPDPSGQLCAGRIAFSDLPIIDAGSRGTIIARDVTADGKLDYVFATGTTIAVARGVGDGTFASPVSSSIGAGAASLSLADVNGDAQPDVLFTTTNNIDDGTAIGVALNTGNGAFGTPQAIETGVQVFAALGVDVNGDGATDLLGLDRMNHRIVVLRKQGMGYAMPALYTASTTTSSDFDVADVTGDGALDVVVTDDAASTVHVLVNSGNGVFAAPVSYATAVDPRSLVLVDVNADSRRDVVVGGRGSLGEVVVQTRLQQANGTLGTATESQIAPGAPAPMWSPQDLAAADVDGDGDVDLVAADMSTPSAAVLRGNGAGQFVSTPILTDTEVYALALGDLDGDGRPDLGLGTPTSMIVYRNTGTPALFDVARREPLEGTGNVALSIRVADINSDGRLDLLPIDGQLLRSELATTTGTFTAGTGVALQVYATYSSFADFNNDGFQDLMVGGPGAFLSAARVVLNHGDGTLEAAPLLAFPMTHLPIRFAAADIDNDGVRDAVVLTQIASTTMGVVYYARGLGDGSFATATMIWSGELALGVAIADLDADGNADILLGTTALVTLAGNGNGTFQPPLTTTLTNGRIALRDLNDDGLADLVSWGTTLDVQLGLGNLSFAAPSRILSRGTFEVSFADLDGDTDLDLVATSSGDATVLLGNDDATFVAHGPFDIRNAGSVELADIDADGHLDLITARDSHATIVPGRCH